MLTLDIGINHADNRLVIINIPHLNLNAIQPCPLCCMEPPVSTDDFLDYIESQSCSPSLSQAQKLKAASKEGALNHGKLLEIMDTKKPSVPPRDPMLTISVSKIARYFPTGYTQEQMVGIIMQLLERNSRHLMPEKQPSLER